MHHVLKHMLIAGEYWIAAALLPDPSVREADDIELVRAPCTSRPPSLTCVANDPP
jgi:hypothetical protein